MTLAAPAFLVALAFLIPIAIAFLVRRQERVLRVPSTMVWRRGAQAVVKNRRFRNLRRLLALAACLLGVAALIVAAARPGGSRKNETIVFVVDVSASMEGSPITQARRYITREVAGTGPNGKIAIVTAGNEARVALPPAPPGPMVDDALRALAAQSGGAAIEEAIALAEGLASGRGRVVVLTDAPVDAEVSRAKQKPTARVFASSGSDNLGIVGMYTRTAPDARDDDDREVTVAVATSSNVARRARVRIELAGALIADREIEIPANGEAVTRSGVRGGGKLVAKVSAGDLKTDATSLDDEALLVEPTRRSLKVGIIGGRKLVNDVDTGPTVSGFFVEKALMASGITEIEHVDPRGPLAKNLDLAVVLDDGPARPHNVPSLFIGAPPPDLGLTAREVTQNQTHVRSIATEDRLMRGVSLDELTAPRAWVSPAPYGARVLVDLDGGPTLISGGTGSTAWVWLGIEPENSDLVLRVAFPVLVGNLVAHLGGATQVVTATTVPRSEVTRAQMSAATPLTNAPEPRWRIPMAPPLFLALVGAMLLALEAWLSFKKRWAA